MKPVLDWLDSNHDRLVRDLAQLVAVPSISTDGEHQMEVEKTAALTCEFMKRAGLHNVAVLRCNGSNPYAYGEWLDAPGQPTLFLYAHHDVQPVNFLEKWQSPPWELTSRSGRLFGRGAADDKGAIVAQLAAIAAFLQTTGSLPVNIKMLVEGEEEVGSRNLLAFLKQYRERLLSDVIVVCDTENIQAGVPSITYSLRGVVSLQVEVRSAQVPVHSGMGGGALADAALALNVILSRFYWDRGPLPVPGLNDRVRARPPRNGRLCRLCPWTRPSCGPTWGCRRVSSSPPRKAGISTNKPGASPPSRSLPRRLHLCVVPPTRSCPRRRPSSVVG